MQCEGTHATWRNLGLPDIGGFPFPGIGMPSSVMCGADRSRSGLHKTPATLHNVYNLSQISKEAGRSLS